ncbi:hypothetical protein JCM6882_003410 [Rhodosporidiobolus microsporus]
MAPSLFLPPELWLKIFEQASLADPWTPVPKPNQPSVPLFSSLSLVSRTFRDLARPLLFKQTRTTRIEALDKLATVVEQYECLSQAVEDVSVVCVQSSGPKNDETSAYKAAVHRLVDKCPHLKSLTICCEAMHSDLCFSLDWAAAGEDRLESLTLAGVAVDNVPSSFFSSPSTQTLIQTIRHLVMRLTLFSAIFSVVDEPLPGTIVNLTLVETPVPENNVLHRVGEFTIQYLKKHSNVRTLSFFGGRHSWTSADRACLTDLGVSEHFPINFEAPSYEPWVGFMSRVSHAIEMEGGPGSPGEHETVTREAESSGNGGGVGDVAESTAGELEGKGAVEDEEPVARHIAVGAARDDHEEEGESDAGDLDSYPGTSAFPFLRAICH